ncbi:hypothetical protein GIB67_019893 [Kingdonia uniflora]|uniref:Annexin n=1 Tax=Kingdonia uniflora TaxID=39325 RepID=A0A7J7MKI6_9MAGN|nr:hypothetical protein GIB67_019893 [Kingdonia uniflora]
MSTIRVPEEVPTPIQDSSRLNQAFQGWGTDEKTIVSILGRRNATQRREIRQVYQQVYKESLIGRLEAELSGDFKNAVILWMLDPPKRDAKLANEVLKMKKKGVDHLKVIIEIACATSPHHLMAVRQIYCSLFDCSLEEDITTYISSPLGKVLVNLVSSYRYDGEVIDMNLAKSEAATLRGTIEKKQLDNEYLVLILSTRNIYQLRATFICYLQTYGNSLYQDIKSCGSSDLASILRAVVWCIDAPEKYFAEVVRASIAGIGTDEDSLTRAIVSRAEIDMMGIRGEYYNANKISLDNAVLDDTSGDYENFLMTLLGTRA